MAIVPGVADRRIERVRASYAAFASWDAEALVALYHPDAVWDLGTLAAAAPRRLWEGHAGVRDLLAENAATLAAFEPRVLELRLDGERLLVRGAYRLSVERMPGFDVESTYGNVFEFRDGLILRVTNTDDPPPGWENATPVE